MQELLIAIFNGISIGSVLLIVALGLAIIFGLMGVINLAHGELIMLGAYTTFVVQNICNSIGTPIANIYIFLAIPIAFIVVAIAGLILEKSVIRFLYGRPLETLLATWGVSLILRQFVRSVNGVLIIGITIFCILYFGNLYFLKKCLSDWDKIKILARVIICFLSLAISITCGFLLASPKLVKPWFSSRNVDVTAPVWLQGGLPIGDFQLPYSRIFIILLTAISLLGIYLFLNQSNWGLRIKAVTQNRSMSACLGIPTNQVDSITFFLGSGLAGIAGCAITLLGSVGPNTGQNYIVDAFMVVVVGGVGNLFGTVIAAMGIGITNYLIGSGAIALILGNTESLKFLTNLFDFFATTSMATVIVFALIIVFLQLKPAGLFPQKGRGVEL